MQSVAFSGLLLVEDAKEASGRPLLLSLVKRATHVGFGARVLCFAEIDSVLQSLLGRSDRMCLVDCLNALESPHQFLIDQARELCHGKNVLVLDTLTVLLRRVGVDRTAALLYSICDVCPVVARFSRDSISDTERNRLRSMANTVLVLTKNAQGQQLCRTVTVKKDAVCVREKIESYEIDPETIAVTSRAVEQSTKTPKAADAAAMPSDFAPCHGNANRVQREKAGVVLPFTRAQTQKGLVGLNANRKTPAGGGAIEYFADKEDDLDDSDPDEELMY